MAQTLTEPQQLERGPELREQRSRTLRAGEKTAKTGGRTMQGAGAMATGGGMAMQATGKGLQGVGKAATAIPVVGTAVGGLMMGAGKGLDKAGDVTRKAGRKTYQKGRQIKNKGAELGAAAELKEQKNSSLMDKGLKQALKAAPAPIKIGAKAAEMVGIDIMKWLKRGVIIGYVFQIGLMLLAMVILITAVYAGVELVKDAFLHPIDTINKVLNLL